MNQKGSRYAAPTAGRMEVFPTKPLAKRFLAARAANRFRFQQDEHATDPPRRHCFVDPIPVCNPLRGDHAANAAPLHLVTN